jgi:cellobiose phosphorylase
MAEIGKEHGYPRKALDSVKKHLDTPYGIVILDPPYAEYHVELGEVSSYPPGYKENAGIFCHNNPWIMIAECIAGSPDTAFEYYRKLCPAYLDDIQDLHKMEPYIYSQMVAGKAASHPGEAKNSWLTGTASWMFVGISQWILGVRADWDGLRIEPCLPRHLKRVEIMRQFRGSNYHIVVENAGKTEKGRLFLVEGRPFDKTVVPPGKPGSTIKVTVTL